MVERQIMEHLTERERLVLEFIPEGHENAIRRRDLAAITKMSERDVREIIYDMVVNRGIPIGSSTEPATGGIFFNPGRRGSRGGHQAPETPRGCHLPPGAGAGKDRPGTVRAAVEAGGGLRAIIPRDRSAKRPGITRCLARAADRLITTMQEWLEAPDSARTKAFAYCVLAVIAGYFAVHVIIFLGIR